MGPLRGNAVALRETLVRSVPSVSGAPTLVSPTRSYFCVVIKSLSSLAWSYRCGRRTNPATLHDDTPSHSQLYFPGMSSTNRLSTSISLSSSSPSNFSRYVSRLDPITSAR